jgi:hypothetical protein
MYFIKPLERWFIILKEPFKGNSIQNPLIKLGFGLVVIGMAICDY